MFSLLLFRILIRFFCIFTLMKTIFALVGTLFIFTSCFNKSNLEEKGWSDFDHLDLKLKGKVYDVNNKIGNGFHGRGIMRVEVLESNIKQYDPRKKQANYYCIINDSIAEIYDYYREISIGDTVLIDTNEEVIEWVNKPKKGKKYSISIGEVSFFDFLREQNYKPFSNQKIVPRWR